MSGHKGPRRGTPTMPGFCPVHGEVQMRGHRSGGNGLPGVQWRCADCHAEHEAKVKAGEIERHPRDLKPKTDDCPHPKMERDPDNDESWCRAYRCPKCGTTAIEAV